MSAPVGVLWAKLAVDHAGFVSDLNKARSSASSIGGQIANSFDRMGRDVNKSIRSVSRDILSLRGVFNTFSLLTGVSAGGFGLLVKSTLDTAEAIEKTSQATGISTKSLQEYRFAAEQSGISMETLDAGLKNFTKTLGHARLGGGPLVEVLKKMDPELLKLVTSAGSTERALQLIWGAMDKTKSASDRAALAAAAFGKSAGVDMVTMISGGVAGLEALRAKANELGVVLDDSMIKKAAETKDKLEILSMVIKTQLSAFIGESLPTISKLTDVLTAIATSATTARKNVSMFSDAIKTLASGPAQLGARVGQYLGGRDWESTAPKAPAKPAPSPTPPPSSPPPAFAAPEKFQETRPNYQDYMSIEAERYKSATAIMQEYRTAEEKIRIEKERIAALQPQLVALTGSEAEANRIVAQAQGQVEKKYEKVSQVAVQAHATISSGLADAILQGKTFTQTINQIGQALIQLATQFAMMKAVGLGFSAMGFPIPGAAHGMVLEGGRPTPFARGGIVNSPTLFPMAGGAGLMGEAGAEAIMPLKRIGGDLGVRAELTGGGPQSIQITQQLMVTGADFGDPALVRRIMRQMADEARFGGLDALRLAGVLKDSADINDRRAR